MLALDGDDAQIVPIDDAGRKSVKLLRKGELQAIAKRPHAMCITLADRINGELLAFIKVEVCSRS